MQQLLRAVPVIAGKQADQLLRVVAVLRKKMLEQLKVALGIALQQREPARDPDLRGGMLQKRQRREGIGKFIVGHASSVARRARSKRRWRVPPLKRRGLPFRFRVGGCARRNGRQPQQQRFIQRGRLHRLADEVIHARFFARVAISLERVRRHRQNRFALPVRQQADLAGRLQAVHHRHLHVHQDQVVVAAARHRHGFFSVYGPVRLHAHTAQQFHGDFAIDRVVFHQEDPGAAM